MMIMCEGGGWGGVTKMYIAGRTDSVRDAIKFRYFVRKKAFLRQNVLHVSRIVRT